MLHLKFQDRQEHNKPKTNRWKKTIKIWVEINKIETKKAIQRLSFEKIINIDKSLVKLNKRKEMIKSNKIRGEKGTITTNCNEIQNIIRKYFKILYSNKL
jgi:hypothetical protein